MNQLLAQAPGSTRPYYTRLRVYTLARAATTKRTITLGDLRRLRKRRAEGTIVPLPNIQIGLEEYHTRLGRLADECRALQARCLFLTQPTLWRSDLSATPEITGMNGHPDTISNAAGVNASALADFLALTFKKLKNLGALFVVQRAFVTEGHGALLDRAIKLATRLLTYALFSLLALRLMPEIASRLRYTMYERRWPTVEATFLGRADSFNPEGTSNNSWFWRFCLSPHSPDSVLNFGAAFAIQI